MTGTQLFYLNHLIRRQNGQKPVKFQKNRYKSVITQFVFNKINLLIKSNIKLPGMCCGQFAIMAAQNAFILPI